MSRPIVTAETLMSKNRFLAKDDGKKRIIVRKTKDQVDYYDASTQEAIDEALRKIFDNTKRAGYYTYIPNRPGELEKEVAELETLAKPLPPGLAPAHYKIKEDADKKLTNAKRSLDHAKIAADLYRLADAGEISAIRAFLWQRMDYEYESIEMVVLK